MSKKPVDYVFTLPDGLQPPYRVGCQIFFAVIHHLPIRQQIGDFGLIRLTDECVRSDGPFGDRHLSAADCARPLRHGGSQWSIVTPPVMEGVVSDIKYIIRDGAVLLCHVEVHSGGKFYTLASGDIVATTPVKVQFALVAYLHASACVALARKPYDSTPEMAQVNQLDWLALNRLQKKTQLELKRINLSHLADTLPIKTAFTVTPMTKKNRIKEIDEVYSMTCESHFVLDLRRSPLKLRGTGGPWFFTWLSDPQTIGRVLHHLSEILFAGVGLPSRKSAEPGLLFSGPHTFTFCPKATSSALPFELIFVDRQPDTGHSVYIRMPSISHDGGPHSVVHADFTTVNRINAACGVFVAQNAITHPAEMVHVARQSIFLAAIQALWDIEAAEDAGSNFFLSDADRRRLAELLAAVKKVPQYRKWLKTNE